MFTILVLKFTFLYQIIEFKLHKKNVPTFYANSKMFIYFVQYSINYEVYFILNTKNLMYNIILDLFFMKFFLKTFHYRIGTS